jgi:hypothetical protein
MVRFAHGYPDAFAALTPIEQPPVAQSLAVLNGQQSVAQIPWAQNVVLMQRVDREETTKKTPQAMTPAAWIDGIFEMPSARSTA